MTDKIILDIRHSDDYTDYLFQTAALTNRRVVPKVSPIRSGMDWLNGSNTTTLHCVATLRGDFEPDDPVVFDEKSKVILVHSRYYLKDDGSVDSRKADSVRVQIEKIIDGELMSPSNLQAVYRHYFPLLWTSRAVIYSHPQYFYVKSGWGGILFDDYYPVGVILKTIEDERRNFRLSLRGGCGCPDPPLLIDYPHFYHGRDYLSLHTWCPSCGARREIKTERFMREGYCNSALESANNYYDKGQGFSALSLFDLIDILQST